ncbi:formimidoylglutamase [bacterium]|nr:formimidoylglutamase [bacterium]
MNSYIPTSSNLFFSKNDPDDIRLGDIVKPADFSTQIPDNSFCISGYPDDEGINLNGGRIGAATAPHHIREFLYKMTPVFAQNSFFDIGDLKPEGELGQRHQTAQSSIQNLHKNKIRTITLGGGHDYGYPDASGFLKAYTGGKHTPIVLNFDAHLDVRPTTKGFNSGTPFYRLLSEFEGQFEFAEIGIQPQCNSIKHRDWALHKKAHIFNLKDIQQNAGLNGLFAHPLFSKITKNTPVFISFDIDCLTSTEAPGCSQSWVTGLKTEDYLKFFLKLAKLADVRGLGIYEVSPRLDIDNRTAKTAALIAYYYLFQDSL